MYTWPWAYNFGAFDPPLDFLLIRFSFSRSCFGTTCPRNGRFACTFLFRFSGIGVAKSVLFSFSFDVWEFNDMHLSCLNLVLLIA